MPPSGVNQLRNLHRALNGGIPTINFAWVRFQRTVTDKEIAMRVHKGTRAFKWSCEGGCFRSSIDA